MVIAVVACSKRPEATKNGQDRPIYALKMFRIDGTMSCHCASKVLSEPRETIHLSAFILSSRVMEDICPLNGSLRLRIGSSGQYSESRVKRMGPCWSLRCRVGRQASGTRFPMTHRSGGRCWAREGCSPTISSRSTVLDLGSDWY